MIDHSFGSIQSAFRKKVSIVDQLFMQENAAENHSITEMTSNCMFFLTRQHTVVFDPKFYSLMMTEIRGVNIHKLKRAEAAGLYFQYLRNHYPKTMDVCLQLRGNMEADLFAEPVSLSPNNNLLKHLVELLADNDQISFQLLKSDTNTWNFHFFENS